jgi:hypothetical protein
MPSATVGTASPGIAHADGDPGAAGFARGPSGDGATAPYPWHRDHNMHASVRQGNLSVHFHVHGWVTDGHAWPAGRTAGKHARVA